MTEIPTVEAFLARARQALGHASPREAMRVLLETMVTALHAQPRPWIAHEDDEVVLLSSPDLTVYHITLSPRIHYPPHDHRMPAMIGLYRGMETSFSYRRNGPSLVEIGRHDHAAPCVAALPAEVIHSVVNPGEARSAAIHVYFGDLGKVARSIWDAELREERPFDNRFYFEQARRL
jgi:predicted metal-dependent enzyme (double-stranded beta helix superfamily)